MLPMLIMILMLTFHQKSKITKTGRREAVWSIVGCKLHEKNMPDATVTLQRPRNQEKDKKHQNECHGVIPAIPGCDVGQKNAANLMEAAKHFKDGVKI